MPGWIIQGVRGEGKTLCAVNLARQYVARGCVVAGNIDLFMEYLSPDDESLVTALRLPDLPRPQDFYSFPFDRFFNFPFFPSDICFNKFIGDICSIYIFSAFN